MKAQRLSKKYTSTLFLISALDGFEWSTIRRGRFLHGGKSRYQLYRRLCWVPGPIWKGAENLVPQSVSISGLSYPGRQAAVVLLPMILVRNQIRDMFGGETQNWAGQIKCRFRTSNNKNSILRAIYCVFYVEGCGLYGYCCKVYDGLSWGGIWLRLAKGCDHIGALTPCKLKHPLKLSACISRTAVYAWSGVEKLAQTGFADNSWLTLVRASYSNERCLLPLARFFGSTALLMKAAWCPS
jgi:hypothetical protein